jgi:hypothetical protein
MSPPQISTPPASLGDKPSGIGTQGFDPYH